jgi:hypothetical protein
VIFAFFSQKGGEPLFSKKNTKLDQEKFPEFQGDKLENSG